MDHLSATFAALSDPTRRAILDRLSEGEASFTALAEPFEMSKPAVVKHLRALERAGLVIKSGSKARPVYGLAAGRLKESRDWLDRYETFWTGALDRLDAYVAEIQSQKGGSA